MRAKNFKAIVIGTSAGGLKALTALLPPLPDDLPIAIIVVNHRMDTPDTYLTDYLATICNMHVMDAEHLAPIESGNIYIAPPGYHLLVADDYCFNLTVDDRVNASRPSIDVTFETAADAYGDKLIGIILTGANSDGAAGIAKIKKLYGFTIAQDPSTAESSIMPSAAINMTPVDFIGTLQEISRKICELCGTEVKENG
jgi:two-component system chemotaxis response regulator CheB